MTMQAARGLSGGPRQSAEPRARSLCQSCPSFGTRIPPARRNSGEAAVCQRRWGCWGMDELLRRRLYGADHDDPDPGPQPGHAYRELVGGPLDGLLLDVTGWSDGQLAAGAAGACPARRWHRLQRRAHRRAQSGSHTPVTARRVASRMVRGGRVGGTDCAVAVRVWIHRQRLRRIKRTPPARTR